jgi:regulator of sirC expression with transglutaminase-like and TPR domain
MSAPPSPSSLLAQVRFDAFASQPDWRMDLDEGALLIADIAYPDLPHGRYRRQLDALAAAVRVELATKRGARSESAARRAREPLSDRAAAEHALGALREVLARREGFRGEEDDSAAPRNSFLNVVLETRKGLPITLSVIYLEVARRLGLPLRGVGLPAHFVVKWPLSREQGGDLFLDVFAGAKLLSYEECRAQTLARLRAAAGAGAAVFDPRWTRPIGARAILTRMLMNLKTAYLMRGETVLAHETVERLCTLHPEMHQELRDRGLLRLALGELLLAAADIATYAERAPRAPDVERLRHRVLGRRDVRASLN